MRCRSSPRVGPSADLGAAPPPTAGSRKRSPLTEIRFAGRRYTAKLQTFRRSRPARLFPTAGRTSDLVKGKSAKIVGRCGRSAQSSGARGCAQCLAERGGTLLGESSISPRSAGYRFDLSPADRSCRPKGRGWCPCEGAVTRNRCRSMTNCVHGACCPLSAPGSMPHWRGPANVPPCSWATPGDGACSQRSAGRDWRGYCVVPIGAANSCRVWRVAPRVPRAAPACMGAAPAALQEGLHIARASPCCAAAAPALWVPPRPRGPGCTSRRAHQRRRCPAPPG